MGLGAAAGVEGDVGGALVMVLSPVGGLGASNTPFPGPPVYLVERSVDVLAPGAPAIGPATGGAPTAGAFGGSVVAGVDFGFEGGEVAGGVAVGGTVVGWVVDGVFGPPVVGLGAGGGVEVEVAGALMFPSLLGAFGASNTPLAGPPVYLLERSDPPAAAPGAPPAAIGAPPIGGGVAPGPPDSAPEMVRAAVFPPGGADTPDTEPALGAGPPLAADPP
ncbi:hypothetical protein ACRAKI_32870 [Saccharothrix isguenensis]